VDEGEEGQKGVCEQAAIIFHEQDARCGDEDALGEGAARIAHLAF
jgi:hypothetical protein